MTLTVRDVIKNALRMMGGLASGDDPTNDELQDALLSYNVMQRGFFGTIIGPRLSAYTLSASATGEPGGQYQCSLSAPATLSLPANPRNGHRIGVADAKLNFSTNNLTVNPNGRLIEGSASNLVLSVAGTTSNRTWFYRGDTGNWTREADQLVDDNPYFPDALIAYLPAMLSVQILSEYGGEIRADLVAKTLEGREAFKRVFSRRGRNQADAPIGVGQAQAASA